MMKKSAVKCEVQRFSPQLRRKIRLLIRKTRPIYLPVFSERGRSLPAALIALAVGSLLLAPFLSFVSSRSLGTRAAADTFRAQYAADAGIEYGIWSLLNDPAYRDQADQNIGSPQSLSLPASINDISPVISVTALSVEGWTEKPPVLSPVKSGGDLVYVIQDSTEYIYALPGGNSNNFYRFDIANESWESRSSTPISVKGAGKLAYPGGDYIYALLDKEGNKSYLYRYDLDNNSWGRHVETPEKLSNDTALTTDGSQYLYAIFGKGQGSSSDIWELELKQNNNKNDWLEAEIPAQVGQGSSLVSDNNNQLFVFPGKNEGFWGFTIPFQDPFNPSTRTNLADPPRLIELAYDGNDVYAFQDGSSAFWKYDVTMDQWVELDPAPAAVGSGGSLVFTDSGRGFAAPGGGSDTFWEITAGASIYEINSQAGSNQTTAQIEINGSNSTILFWDIQ